MKSMKRILGLLVLGTAALMAEDEQNPPAPATAAPAAPAPTPQAKFGNFTWKGIKLSGVADGYYSKAFNNPSTGNNQLRNFDADANSWDLNMLKFNIEKSAEPWGFRVDLGMGKAFTIFQLTEPTRRVDQLEPVMQAFVSFKPKQWKGVQVDFGKFFTSAGAELTDSNLVWNYSRAYLYANGPYYHVGLRVTAPITKEFTAGFQVLNGWNNVVDNNRGKTLGFTGVYTKGKYTYSNVYYVGPEKFKPLKGVRHFWDQVLAVNVTDKFSTYLNFDLGFDRGAVEPVTTGAKNGTAKFNALGWAYRYQINKRFAFANRYEYYYDGSGYITGQAQTLKEATFTFETKLAEGLLTRLEYRNDNSNKPYWVRETGKTLGKNMPTFTIGLIGFFGPKS